MSLRSTYARVGITLAAGSLVALAAAAPALADDDWDPGIGDSRESGLEGGDGDSDFEGDDEGESGFQGGDGREDPGRGDGLESDFEGGDGLGPGFEGGDGREDPGRGDGRNRDNGDERGDRGRVIAPDGLALRSSPNRDSRLIRIARRGELVSIFCETSGQPVRGNPLWYLLADGTWAWAPAHYIETFGPEPRWCGNT